MTAERSGDSERVLSNSRRGEEQRRDTTGSRGQLVLLAAAAIAIALVPLALAYVGLGYNADVGGDDPTAPLSDAERVLERSTHNATSTVAGEYDWENRDRAAATLGTRLDRDTEQLERSRLSSGVAYRIERNDSAATRWGDDHCPSGPNRAFGPCEAIDGIVVQERAGETAVVAVAFDVHATTERGVGEMTLVIQPTSEA